jgi:hypothetical protein
MEKAHKTGSITECVQTIIDNQLKELESMEKETLEEAFETFKKQYPVLKNYSLHNLLQVARFGAKWQQEQDKNKFSEKDMINVIKYTLNNIFNGKLAGLNSEEIFEQFKKK